MSVDPVLDHDSGQVLSDTYLVTVRIMGMVAQRFTRFHAGMSSLLIALHHQKAEMDV